MLLKHPPHLYIYIYDFCSILLVKIVIFGLDLKFWIEHCSHRGPAVWPSPVRRKVLGWNTVSKRAAFINSTTPTQMDSPAWHISCNLAIFIFCFVGAALLSFAPRIEKYPSFQQNWDDRSGVLLFSKRSGSPFYFLNHKKKKRIEKKTFTQVLPELVWRWGTRTPSHTHTLQDRISWCSSQMKIRDVCTVLSNIYLFLLDLDRTLS